MEEIFAGGVRWFHSGGIFAALSQTTAEVNHRGHAGSQSSRRNCFVRSQLSAPNSGNSGWSRTGGRGHRTDRQKCGCARWQRRRLQLGLRDSRSGGRRESPSWIRSVIGMIGRVTNKIPQIKIVATTLREVHSTNRHSWGAVAWIMGKTISRPPVNWTSSIGSGAETGSPPGLSTGCLRVNQEDSGKAGLGPRRVADNLSGRHDDGVGRSSPGICQRGFGPNSTIAFRLSPIAECCPVVLLDSSCLVSWPIPGGLVS